MPRRTPLRLGALGSIFVAIYYKRSHLARGRRSARSWRDLPIAPLETLQLRVWPCAFASSHRNGSWQTHPLAPRSRAFLLLFAAKGHTWLRGGGSLDLGEIYHFRRWKGCSFEFWLHAYLPFRRTSQGCHRGLGWCGLLPGTPRRRSSPFRIGIQLGKSIPLRQRFWCYLFIK